MVEEVLDFEVEKWQQERKKNLPTSTEKSFMNGTRGVLRIWLKHVQDSSCNREREELADASKMIFYFSWGRFLLVKEFGGFFLFLSSVLCVILVAYFALNVLINFLFLASSLAEYKSNKLYNHNMDAYISFYCSLETTKNINKLQSATQSITLHLFVDFLTTG